MIVAAPRYIAVVDIGKTNVKVALVDAREWREIDVRAQSNAVLRVPPYPHFDTVACRRFLLASLTDLNNAVPVEAIAITAHGAAGAVLDAEGNLALPILDYEFDGVEATGREYDAIRPPFDETGSPRLAGGLNLGAQLYWQMERFPSNWQRVAHIVTLAQYWAHELTGIPTTEVTSLGCHTDLWSPEHGNFSTLVDALDWRKLMAPVHKATDIIGSISADIAKQTGLDLSTPVYCGIHDSNASLFPHVLSRVAPFSVVSTGTWVVSMSVGGTKKSLDRNRDTLINVNALGDPVPSARFMGGREFSLLLDGDPRTCSREELSRVLSNRMMLSPAVENRSGPFQGIQHQWWGGNADISEGERFAVVSCYLAMMTATCLEMIGADGPTVVEGPFAANTVYIAQLAAATLRPVSRSVGSATGTSIGAAMLSVAGREIDNESFETVEPDNEAMIVYAERWREQVAALQ